MTLYSALDLLERGDPEASKARLASQAVMDAAADSAPEGVNRATADARQAPVRDDAVGNLATGRYGETMSVCRRILRVWDGAAVVAAASWLRAGWSPS